MLIGKLENEIIEFVCKEKIDYDKIEELFKKGANPNALEDESPEKEGENIYWFTFFKQCIFSSNSLKRPHDLYPLLEMFIKYGLDVNKYGSSIIDDFHFLDQSSDIYEMTKLVLDHVTDRDNICPAVAAINTVEAWLNNSYIDYDDYDDYDGDVESNDFYGLSILVDSFVENKPYNSFYRLPRIINETFKNIYINGDFVVLEKNKLSVKIKNYENTMFTKLNMEKNSLIVVDNYGVYINNDDTHTYIENEFTEYANEYFKDERIIDLEFKHYSVKLSSNSEYHDRMATINFTNSKKLKYTVDPKKDLITLEII